MNLQLQLTDDIIQKFNELKETERKKSIAYDQWKSGGDVQRYNDLAKKAMNLRTVIAQILFNLVEEHINDTPSIS